MNDGSKERFFCVEMHKIHEKFFGGREHGQKSNFLTKFGIF